MTTLTITGKSGAKHKFTKDAKGICHHYYNQSGKTWLGHKIIPIELFTKAQAYLKKNQVIN